MHIFLTSNGYGTPRDSLLSPANFRMRKILLQDGLSFVGICFFVSGLSALGYQYLLWVKCGIWFPLCFRHLLGLICTRETLFAWQGSEKISAWIYDLPLSGVLFTMGIVALALGVATTAGGSAAGAAQNIRRPAIDLNTIH